MSKIKRWKKRDKDANEEAGASCIKLNVHKKYEAQLLRQLLIMSVLWTHCPFWQIMIPSPLLYATIYFLHHWILSNKIVYVCQTTKSVYKCQNQTAVLSTTRYNSMGILFQILALEEANFQPFQGQKSHFLDFLNIAFISIDHHWCSIL